MKSISTNIFTDFSSNVSYAETFHIDKLAVTLSERGVAHVNGFLDQELLNILYNEVLAYESASLLTQAAIGRGTMHLEAEMIRSDKTRWIEGSTMTQKRLQEYLEMVRLELNERLMLGLFDVEAHYAVYYPGDFYARHKDSFKGKRNRILSLVIYLNKEWVEADGGQLVLYQNEDDTYPSATILPEYGHAVFFLSEEIPHEVLVARRNRYSIAAWFRCAQVF